jgi:hypothetical protein
MDEIAMKAAADSSKIFFIMRIFFSDNIERSKKKDWWQNVCDAKICIIWHNATKFCIKNIHKNKYGVFVWQKWRLSAVVY